MTPAWRVRCCISSPLADGEPLTRSPQRTKPIRLDVLMSLLEIMQEAQRLVLLQPLILECKPSQLGSNAEIVEIAVIAHDGSMLLDELVRPVGPISAEGSKLHGLNADILRSAPSWKEVWPQVRSTLSQHTICIYGLKHSLSWMSHSHRANFLPWELDTTHLVCLMQLFASFHNERLDSTGHYRTFPLHQAAETMGLTPEPLLYPRALDDARLVRQLLLSLAEPGKKIW